MCHNDVYYQKMNTFKHEVTLPHFKESDIIGSSTYSRTLRENGFRLQQQNIDDKCIFHNYGQGDAQFSLAYGCSYIISKIITVKQDATKIKQVAVLGHGINALMTCLQLLKRGYKVTLYAKNLPIKRGQNNQKITQPQEGLQFWYPGGYDNCDPLKHQLVSKLSFQFLKECLLANRYQSLKLVNCYCAGPKVQQLKQQVTQFINNQIKDAQINFGVEKMENFICYKTILINTELFMEEIFTQLKLRNIVVVQKDFKTLNQVKQLRQKHIFNCLGIQNKQIFGDGSIQQLKGFYISISKQLKSSPEAFAIWISSEIQRQQDFVISIAGPKMQISSRGIITESSMKQITDKVLARAYHFIKERTIKPFKL